MSKIHEDYYKILQVDPAADPEVITAAYRRLAVGDPSGAEALQHLAFSQDPLADHTG